MFDLTAKRTVWIPVRWPSLIQIDPGGIAVKVDHEIECQIELLDRDQIDAVDAKVAKFKDETDGTSTREGEVETLMGLCLDWRKVKAGTADVPFNRENAARMVAQPGFTQAFRIAFLDALNGIAETREKNSEGSPSTGQAAASPEKTTSKKTASVSE